MLVAYWPFQSLSLSDLFDWPRLSLQILHDFERFWAYVQHYGPVTACLAQSFIKCLEKRRLFGRLEVLDLRGCICPSPVVKYLATYAVLSYNEQRQKALQDAIDRARSRLSLFDSDIIAPMQLDQIQETTESSTLLEGNVISYGL